MRQVLLIEDSPEYQVLVRAALKATCEVHCATDAQLALTLLSRATYDLILIDVGLPGRDGLSLCEELRADPKLQSVPILFVTGRRDTADVVQGFAAGADDYIQKPFHPEELRVRVEARLKRVAAASRVSDNIVKGDFDFSIGKQRVSLRSEGRELDLTPNEFKILFLLAKNEGQVLTRETILKEVWGEKLHVVARTVDKHVCALRRKLGASASSIVSVSGQGYVFKAAVDRLRSASGN